VTPQPNRQVALDSRVRWDAHRDLLRTQLQETGEIKLLFISLRDLAGAAATDVRLRDAQTVGDLLDDAREALEAAYGELARAEEHHRWHHEQEGREVELDDERLRVLMVIAEALDSLGADDEGPA
jgi:hypothetical protein